MLNYKNSKTLNKLNFTQIRDYYQNSCKQKSMYGLEYEKIAIDSTTYKNASYDYMEKIIKNFSHMKGWGVLYDDKTIIGALGEGSSVSLEPGCQFELSLEAKENIADIEKSAKEIFSLTQRIAKFYNVEFLNCGITPYSTYENINIVKKQRYEIMAEYLPKRAKLAPVMMRETAGVQLNVDYKSEDDAIEKIKLLSFISPFLTGFYANSPIRNNNLSGFKSFRAFAWKYTGKDRCGLFYKNLLDKKNATFDDYINAILDVPMLFIERGGKKIPINGEINFYDFMKNGYQEHFATLEDYILHSSLCFPDIRLKKCIEIRNHDSQNLPFALSVCAFYKGILNSDYNEILSYFKDINTNDIEIMGFLAARYGTNFKYKNFSAKDFTKKLFEIAKQNLPQEEKHYLNCAFSLLEQGMCIADVVLKNNIKNSKELIEFLKRDY